MSIYVLPALLALAVKVYVMVLARAANTSRLFNGMVLLFAFHNLTEVVAYMRFADGLEIDILFRLYYVATLAIICYLCIYSAEVAKISILKKFYVPLSVWFLACSALVMVTDFVVAGYTSIGYSATAVQGPLYWVFAVTNLVSVIAVVAFLIFGYRSSDSHVTQIQCLYSLAALAPVLLVGFAVLPLLMLEQEINAGGILPICTTLFLLITLQSESKHRFTDIRRYLPFSKERKIADEVMSLISRFSMDEISYKDLSNEIEKIALKSKLAQADDSISEAARLLKMKRTTLYSMLNRHGIEREGKSDG